MLTSVERESRQPVSNPATVLPLALPTAAPPVIVEPTGVLLSDPNTFVAPLAPTANLLTGDHTAQITTAAETVEWSEATLDQLLTIVDALERESVQPVSIPTTGLPITLPSAAPPAIDEPQVLFLTYPFTFAAPLAPQANLLTADLSEQIRTEVITVMNGAAPMDVAMEGTAAEVALINWSEPAFQERADLKEHLVAFMERSGHVIPEEQLVEMIALCRALRSTLVLAMQGGLKKPANVDDKIACSTWMKAALHVKNRQLTHLQRCFLITAAFYTRSRKGAATFGEVFIPRSKENLFKNSVKFLIPQGTAL